MALQKHKEVFKGFVQSDEILTCKKIEVFLNRPPKSLSNLTWRAIAENLTVQVSESNCIAERKSTDKQKDQTQSL
jgi:hypothetical protein